MSTTITILEHLWGSPLLQEGFAQIGAKNGDPVPSLHSMFSDLTKGLTDFHYDWYIVTADEQGPSFRLVQRTAEEWEALLMGLNADISDLLFRHMIQRDE